MDCKSIGIYVPSYKRSDCIMTHNILPDCTYVVRETEADLYKSKGVKVLAVKDEYINSLPKVRQWIIDNTPEDIVIQVDDDLQGFYYQNKSSVEQIVDPAIVLGELERNCQILEDLKLGFMAFNMQLNVIKYNQEYGFKGCIGGIVAFNKEYLKGQYDQKNKFKCDIDMELQELLKNRIILSPKYIGFKGLTDTNKGGANEGKTRGSVDGVVSYMKLKWGKHFDFNKRSNQVKINVKR